MSLGSIALGFIKNPMVQSIAAGILADQIVSRATDNEEAGFIAGTAGAVAPFALGRKDVIGDVSEELGYFNKQGMQINPADALTSTGKVRSGITINPIRTNTGVVGTKFGFKNPGWKNLAFTAGIPLAMYAYGKLKSNNTKPTKNGKPKQIDPITGEVVDPDKKQPDTGMTIEDQFKSLHNDLDKEYQDAINSIRVPGSYIDPMNPTGIDFDRAKQTVRAGYEAAAGMAAVGVLSAIAMKMGNQGAIGEMAKANLMTSEVLNKTRNAMFALDSARKGNREAAGQVRTFMGDLEAIGVNNKAIQESMAQAASLMARRSEALYNAQKDSLYAIGKINAKATKTNTLDPMKNIGTIQDQVKFAWKTYDDLRKEFGDNDKRVIEALGYYNAYKAKMDEMAGVKSSSTGVKAAKLDAATLKAAMGS